MKEVNIEKEFWTQQELAERYGVVESTIKNWRDRGCLPFLRFPGSDHVLYPVAGIKEAEASFLTQSKESRKKSNASTPVVKRKKPEVSTTPNTEWRI